MTLSPPPIQRVLIVDHGEARDTLARAFAAHHWRVHACPTARVALQLAGLDEFHAIVANLRLPDERGDALLFRITALQPWMERRAALLADTAADVKIAAHIAANMGWAWHATPVDAERVATQLIGTTGP